MWLVLLILCASLVQGHTDPLDMLDLDELLELKKAYEKELAVGHDSNEWDNSNSEDSLSSDESDGSEEMSDSLDNFEDAVGVQDKDGWIIYPEWAQWDPLGEDHGYHPINEDKAPSRHERTRHRRPERRRRRHYRRRRPRSRRERSVGRSHRKERRGRRSHRAKRSHRSHRRERRSRRDYDDYYDSDEVALGDILSLLDSDEIALGAKLENYLFDEDDSFDETALGDIFDSDEDYTESMKEAQRLLQRLLDGEDI